MPCVWATMVWCSPSVSAPGAATRRSWKSTSRSPISASTCWARRVISWNVALYERLTQSRDGQLAAIAAKAIKEARYHLRFSRGWLVRLGDGTETSAQKMQQAIDSLWRFTAELFDADEVELELIESGVAVDPRLLRQPWESEVYAGLNEACLQVPAEVAYRTGGRQGLHTEHLGPMLAEMQYLQRAYPGQQW